MSDPEHQFGGLEIAAHAVREPIAGEKRRAARERNHLCRVAQRSPVLLEQREGVSLLHRPFAER